MKADYREIRFTSSRLSRSNTSIAMSDTKAGDLNELEAWDQSRLTKIFAIIDNRPQFFQTVQVCSNPTRSTGTRRAGLAPSFSDPIMSGHA